MTLLSRMEIRILPIAENAMVLEECIVSAGEALMVYTNRDSVPKALEGVQLDLAVIRYNQRGIEGESSHSEGGISRSISSLPAETRALLDNWRLAKTGG